MSARSVLLLFCVLGGGARKIQGTCWCGSVSVHRRVDGLVRVPCDHAVKECKLAFGFSFKRELDTWFY